MPKPRGRPPGFRLTNEHRAKISNSNILNALIEHVEGAREMTATQVSAGIALLKKVMPDLAAQADMEDNGELTPMSRMTDDALEAIAAGRSAGASTQAQSPSKLN